MTCPAGPTPGLPAGAMRHSMFCVNRWQSVPVFDLATNPGSGIPNPQIGVINVNDYFRWEWEWHRVTGILDQCVLIRNFNGQLEWGYFNSHHISSGDRGLLFSAVFAFPRANFTWNGMNLREFTIQNRTAELRDREGLLIETLAIGTRIGAGPLLSNAVKGQTWCTFWRIAAVYRNLGIAGVPPQWYWADMSRNEHAFVDTGLPHNRPTTSTIRTSLA